MADPTTINRLRGLVLSAVEVKGLTGWPDAMVEDYLNILSNIISLAELIDVEIDQKIEEIPTDFTDGSIPYADSGLLVEDNTNLFWDDINNILNALDIIIPNLTASRLVSSDSNKKLASVSDLTAWILGTDLQPVNDDTDGTVSNNDDELEFFIQAVA